MRHLAIVLAVGAVLPASAADFSVSELPALPEPAALTAPAAPALRMPTIMAGLSAAPLSAAPAAPASAPGQAPASASASLRRVSGAVSNSRGDAVASAAAAFDGTSAKFSRIERDHRAPAAVDGRIALSKIDASDTGGMTKKQALEKLAKDQVKLDERQQILYADGRRRVLIVLQGMDTAGKEGTIRHVMKSLNPQGVQVHSFKKPTAEERAHPYLWRIQNALDGFGKGMIGIFNRSHYEDILVPSVINSLPKAKVKELFGTPAYIPQ